MSRPRLLDLFCGAGGASMGYHLAGFDVLGVDLHPQPDYPFRFVQGDAMAILKRFNRYFRGRIDVIAASPPCQHYSTATPAGSKDNWPDLVPPVQQELLRLGLPYVIENVVGAPLRRDLLLCGEMFRLQVIRHRIFQTYPAVRQPEHLAHRGLLNGGLTRVRTDRGLERITRFGEPYFGVYGSGWKDGRGTTEEWQQALGVDWTSNRQSLAESIPPAYTRYIGERLLA